MVFVIDDVLNGLVGGLLIGTAAALYLLLDGRITGISGILGDAFFGSRHRFAENLAFLVGLVAVPAAYAAPMGLPSIGISSNIPLVVDGGVLVGFGTRLGNGCTSGHGVCGLSRFSKRSVVATGLFMVAAVVTVFVMRLVGIG